MVSQSENIFTKQKGAERATEVLTLEARRMRAVETVAKRLLTEIEKRFGANSEKPLEYHNVNHTKRVVAGIEEILGIIAEVERIEVVLPEEKIISSEIIAQAQILGLGHDVIQESSMSEASGLRVRQRGVEPGQNERESAETLIKVLDEVLEEEQLGRKKEILGLDNKTIIEEINVTYPDLPKSFVEAFPATEDIKTHSSFNWSEEEWREFSQVFFNPTDAAVGLKIFQPYLTADSSIRAFALAQADLRQALWQEEIINSGNAEFKELYENYTKNIRVARQTEDDQVKNQALEFLRSRKAEIIDAIGKWKRTQIGFVKWQILLFLDSLDQNNVIKKSPAAEKIKTQLRHKLLPGMLQSLSAVRGQYAKFLQDLNLPPEPDQWKETFNHLTNTQYLRILRDFVGYEIPNNLFTPLEASRIESSSS